MMIIQQAKSINGALQVPGDKSISHRGVMLGAIARGTTVIQGFLMGADCLSTIDCFRKMGINIQLEGNTVTVQGRGLYGLSQPKEILYTGNSGTTTRLLCGLLAGQNFSCDITGDASICRRPMNRVRTPLTSMGADISGDFCPLHINGSRLHGITYPMPVASAQVKTAILLAGLYADSQTCIKEKETSRDHTERMLSAMGADIQVDSGCIVLNPGKEMQGRRIEVPGDISSAAFFMAAAAIMPNSCVTIQNVGINPTRTGIIDVFRKMGANITIENQRLSAMEPVGDITVRTSSLKGITIGGNIIPRLIDELPIIAVMAAFAEGTTVIRDAQELKVKETNRIRAVVDEFQKCGVSITETEDGMIITGGQPVHGADFTTYGDHRMAMSLSVLAQRADAPCSIDDETCINVSFPGFLDLFHRLCQL